MRSTRQHRPHQSQEPNPEQGYRRRRLLARVDPRARRDLHAVRRAGRSRRRVHLRPALRAALTVADVAWAAGREGAVDVEVGCPTGSPPPVGALAPAHLSRGAGARPAARTCAGAAMSVPRPARALRLPIARRTDGDDPHPSRGARAGRQRPERSVAERQPGPTPLRAERALSRTRHPWRSRAGRGTVRRSAVGRGWRAAARSSG